MQPIRPVAAKRAVPRGHAPWVALLVLCVPASASAQRYPERAIRYVVTDQPGSNIDALARIVSERLSEQFGQPVIVDNRAGAGGNIGAEIGARAPADGHTVVQLASTHAANASLYRKLPYDLLRDFAPVSQLASGPSVVVVPAASPLRSIADLVRTAKEKPGSVQYASAGTGTCTFLSAELFKRQAAVDMMHVAYKGGAPAITSVLAGETGVYFAPLAPALPQIRQGRLRALAVTSPKPLQVLPDLPTVSDAGVPGYQFSCWYGMFVPTGTPSPIVATLHGAVASMMNNTAVRRRLEDLGFLPVGDRPEQFAAYVRAEVKSARELVRGIEPQ